MFAGNGFVVTPRVKTPRMTTEKESETLSLRLSKADKAMLDELVEAKRQELAPLGATTSLAQYVRGWIRSTHAAMVAKRNQRSTYESALTLPASAAPTPTPTPAATPPATVPAPSPKSARPAAAPAPTAAQVRRKLQASKRTGADLARATGIDEAMLSRFRSGKKPLSPEKLARLADELTR